MKILARYSRWRADVPEPWVWLWLWVPLGVLVAQIGTRFLDPGGRVYERIFESELGLIESLTAAVLVLGMVYGIRGARWFLDRKRRWPAWP